MEMEMEMEMEIRGVGPRPNRTIPDRSVSLLTSTHSLLLETQTRMSCPRLSCGSCDLSLASAKWTHYSRRISWGLHHGAGHSTEFATDPPFPWDLYENGIAIRTWPCVWPVQEGLSGLSWVRLAWSRQTTILAVAKYKTPADPTAPSCSNSPRLSNLRTVLAILIKILQASALSFTKAWAPTNPPSLGRTVHPPRLWASLRIPRSP